MSTTLACLDFGLDFPDRSGCASSGVEEGFAKFMAVKDFWVGDGGGWV